MKINFDQKKQCYSIILNGKNFIFTNNQSLMFFLQSYIDGFFVSSPNGCLHIIYKNGEIK